MEDIESLLSLILLILIFILLTIPSKIKINTCVFESKLDKIIKELEEIKNNQK